MNKQQALIELKHFLIVHLDREDFWSDDSYYTEIEALATLGDTTVIEALKHITKP